MWQRIYHRYSDPIALRFQPGAQLPTQAVNGDRYVITDDTYSPDNSSLAEFNRALKSTVNSAVGRAMTWLDPVNDLTVREALDGIRNSGQLVLMQSPYKAGRHAYGSSSDPTFGSLGKRNIDPREFHTRIAVVTPLEYSSLEPQLDKKITSLSEAKDIRSMLEDEVLKRVDDAITIHFKGAVSPYAIPPNWDADPNTFLSDLEELADMM